MRKLITAVALAVGVLVPATGVLSAAGAPAGASPVTSYPLGHARACRADFVKRTERHVVRVRVRVSEHVKGHVRVVVKVQRKSERYVACVYVARKATVTLSTAPAATTTTTTSPPAAPKVSYAARVDPTYTQNPNNPFAITWAYSADATATLGNVTTDLASTAQLPSGVLNFYSDGLLSCSMNVGAGTSGG
ncbi:MAG: hypothetical protein JWM85_2346, partial [Acidimicrobiaceae bacterium]|nr:hypothetical protein [Acidimicrobiaceae bacterium]